MIKIVIKLIFLLGIISVIWFYNVLVSGNGLEEEKYFVVEKGQGVNTISQNLYEQDIIKDKFVFETWLWLKKLETKILTGNYTIPADVSIRELTNILIVGAGEEQQSFTILEGWNRNNIADALNKKGISGQDFLNLTARASDWVDYYDFLSDAPSQASLEGFIFPNTHFINNNTTATEIIEKTLVDFDKQLTDDLRKEINRQGKTIFEVITLASIIEREVPVYADKRMIADVFLKRLDDGIGLQSDATINFITGKGMAQPTYADLEVDSQYNTYKWKGLPPGPISNPGIDSIKAVIYPTSNPYYYFLTTKEGDVIYSRDYNEHLANKRKYLD